MKTINNHKFYEFEEATDIIFGKDTEERKAYEAYAVAERAKEDAKLHRISVPAALYNKLCQRAAISGQSVSSYVRSALASIVL